MSINNSNFMSGFLTTQGAASYTDYSYDHFRKLALKFNIPRYGNGKNRFSIADLDKWMQDTECFLVKPAQQQIVKRELLPIPM